MNTSSTEVHFWVHWAKIHASQCELCIRWGTQKMKKKRENFPTRLRRPPYFACGVDGWHNQTCQISGESAQEFRSHCRHVLCCVQCQGVISTGTKLPPDIMRRVREAMRLSAVAAAQSRQHSRPAAATAASGAGLRRVSVDSTAQELSSLRQTKAASSHNKSSASLTTDCRNDRSGR